MSWFDLSGLASRESALWLNGLNTYNGFNDKIPLEAMGACSGSLRLIHVQRLSLAVFAPGEAFGNSKRRVQGRFRYAASDYRLWVTDPVYERRYLAKLDGEYAVEDCFLTISLGEERELGGRSDDPRCYEDGRIYYDRVAETPHFQDGIAKLLQDAGGHSMALMCAEKEPLDCHRALLVAPALADQGLDVTHIHADGVLEPHGEAMDRLLAKFKLLQQDDLFAQPRTALIKAAIQQQTTRVGHAQRSSHSRDQYRRSGG